MSDEVTCPKCGTRVPVVRFGGAPRYCGHGPDALGNDCDMSGKVIQAMSKCPRSFLRLRAHAWSYRDWRGDTLQERCLRGCGATRIVGCTADGSFAADRPHERGCPREGLA